MAMKTRCVSHCVHEKHLLNFRISSSVYGSIEHQLLFFLASFSVSYKCISFEAFNGYEFACSETTASSLSKNKHFYFEFCRFEHLSIYFEHHFASVVQLAQLFMFVTGN